MRKFLMMLAVSGIGTIASAQSISPVYAEAKTGKTVKGQFAVQNLGVSPLPVTIEPRQLQMIDGKPQFGSVLPGVEVVLRDTSAVVSPKSSRTFDYTLKCPTDCMVSFWAGMVTGRTKEGIQVKTWLMSSVYACDKIKGCRERTKKAAGLL